MELFREQVNNEYRIQTEGSSEGTQIKYYKDGYWYKEDKLGEEGLVEYLVSNVLRFSTLDSSEYVMYECGKINYATGCRSKNFLGNIEDAFMTYHRVYKNLTGYDLTNTVNNIEGIPERFEYVIEFFRTRLDYDIVPYLKKMLTLDYLTLNSDRHFNNLGFIYTKDGKIIDAPIFDNGLSLLNGNASVNRNFDIATNVKRVTARPFSGSHKKMLEYIGVGIKFDIDAALNWMNGQEPSYYRDVFQYQLEINRDLLGYKKNINPKVN